MLAKCSKSIADGRAAIGEAGTIERRVLEDLAMDVILRDDRVLRSAKSGKRQGNDVAPPTATGLVG
jgi:hypothetical protein